MPLDLWTVWAVNSTRVWRSSTCSYWPTSCGDLSSLWPICSWGTTGGRTLPPSPSAESTCLWNATPLNVISWYFVSQITNTGFSSGFTFTLKFKKIEHGKEFYLMWILILVLSYTTSHSTTFLIIWFLNGGLFPKPRLTIMCVIFECNKVFWNEK